MMSEAICSAVICFSYGQFQVFDRTVRLPGLAWTEAHVRQGFARQEQNVSFATLLEFGKGDVAVHLAPYPASAGAERAIEVPFEVSSGHVVIGGPEEFPDKCIVSLSTGHYRLVAAQRATVNHRETIDLYFQKLSMPLAKSRILVGVDAVNLSLPLLESADAA